MTNGNEMKIENATTTTQIDMNELNAMLSGELLTLNEVAAKLKVSRKTLYAWKAQGKLPFVKIAGFAVRVPASEVAKLLQPQPAKITNTTTNQERIN